jgi:hypothetical protein
MLGNSSLDHAPSTSVVWAARPSQRAGHGSVGTKSRPAALEDAVIAVCFLVLVGVVVFGGLFMLFSWVTAGLPTSALTACPRVDGCMAPSPAENPAAWVEALPVDEPLVTP